jgi:hypothetical protein
MEHTLYFATEIGDEKWVRKIFSEHPNTDVNWINDLDFDRTALHAACQKGRERMVSLLLAHPNIDVNRISKFNYTPLIRVCINGDINCLRLLLDDPRVKLNEVSETGSSAIIHAVEVENFDSVKVWIASGREMALESAIKCAKRTTRADMVLILKKFRDKPEKTRHDIRLELNWYNERAARFFCQVVFLCDGLLKIKGKDEDISSASNASRFFRIARKLPLEIQTILCCRVVDSSEDIIPSKCIESGFRELARALWI